MGGLHGGYLLWSRVLVNGPILLKLGDAVLILIDVCNSTVLLVSRLPTARISGFGTSVPVSRPVESAPVCVITLLRVKLAVVVPAQGVNSSVLLFGLVLIFLWLGSRGVYADHSREAIGLPGTLGNVMPTLIAMVALSVSVAIAYTSVGAGLEHGFGSIAFCLRNLLGNIPLSEYIRLVYYLLSKFNLCGSSTPQGYPVPQLLLHDKIYQSRDYSPEEHFIIPLSHRVGSLEQVTFVRIVDLRVFSLLLDPCFEFQFHLLRFCWRLKDMSEQGPC